MTSNKNIYIYILLLVIGQFFSFFFTGLYLLHLCSFGHPQSSSRGKICSGVKLVLLFKSLSCVIF